MRFNCCRVEKRRGGDFGLTPFPLLAHQTGRAELPHPAFRLISPRGPRRRTKVHASQT